MSTKVVINESPQYKLSVSDGTDQTLSVTNGIELQVTLNAGAQGPAGPTGPQGETGPAGPNEITTATDVAISNPLNGQPLIYDSSTQLWKNEGQTGITCAGVSFDNGQNSGVSIGLQVNEEYSDGTEFYLPPSPPSSSNYLAVADGISGRVNFTSLGGIDVSSAVTGDGFIFDGFNWVSSPIGDITPNPLTVSKRNSLGGLEAKHIRIYNAEGDAYSQINSFPSLSQSRSFDFPNSSGVVATNNTALMLTGTQTAAGAKTFSGQMELTGQSATNGTSALTRALGDSRYFPSFCDFSTLPVTANSVTLATAAALTLDSGIYYFEAYAATYTPVGTPANTTIRLFTPDNATVGFYGSDDYGNTPLSHIDVEASSLPSAFIRQSSGAANTFSRRLTGIVKVAFDETPLLLEFRQSTSSIYTVTCRSGAFMIARRMSDYILYT